MHSAEMETQGEQRAEEFHAKLLRGRKTLPPPRNDFIIANFWLLVVPFLSKQALTSEQKLLVFNTFLNKQYEEELAITRADIGPPKKGLNMFLTSYGVEKGVLKQGGDFSLELLTKNLGKPRSERAKALYRQFGEATLKPHIVFTKVVQRQEFKVKGRYGKDDNMGEIQMLTKLFKKRLERENSVEGKLKREREERIKQLIDK